MNDNHEILPSPQGDKIPPSGPEYKAGSPGNYAPESEYAASQAMEKPMGSPPVSDPSVGQVSQPAGLPHDTVVGNAPHAGQGTSVQQPSQDNTLPQIADDVDLIEKEWVNKTKEIVQETKDDPYRQNKKIVHLRADYMKKRYNKDIKIVKD